MIFLTFASSYMYTFLAIRIHTDGVPQCSYRQASIIASLSHVVLAIAELRDQLIITITTRVERCAYLRQAIVFTRARVNLP